MIFVTKEEKIALRRALASRMRLNASTMKSRQRRRIFLEPVAHSDLPREGRRINGDSIPGIARVYTCAQLLPRIRYAGLVRLIGSYCRGDTTSRYSSRYTEYLSRGKAHFVMQLRYRNILRCTIHRHIQLYMCGLDINRGIRDSIYFTAA